MEQDLQDSSVCLPLCIIMSVGCLVMEHLFLYCKMPPSITLNTVTYDHAEKKGDKQKNVAMELALKESSVCHPSFLYDCEHGEGDRGVSCDGAIYYSQSQDTPCTPTPCNRGRKGMELIGLCQHQAKLLQ